MNNKYCLGSCLIKHNVKTKDNKDYFTNVTLYTVTTTSGYSPAVIFLIFCFIIYCFDLCLFESSFYSVFISNIKSLTKPRLI